MFIIVLLFAVVSCMGCAPFWIEMAVEPRDSENQAAAPTKDERSILLATVSDTARTFGLKKVGRPGWSEESGWTAADWSYEILALYRRADSETAYSRWSPDGQKISFMSQLNSFWPGTVFSILLMDSTGDNLEELPFPPPTVEDRNRDDGGAVWSPDSERMAFSSDRDGQYEIYVMDRDGSNQTNLTNNSSEDYRPSWSRDGSRIAFVSWRDNAQYEQIYVMDADGTNTIRLSDDTANDTRPSWSPDGTQLAFASDRDGNWEIYVMDADGSNLKNITQSPWSDTEPAWGQ